MPEFPAFATAPAHVRAVDFGHVLVLVDHRAGRVQCLLPAAARRWREAALTGRTRDLPAHLASYLLGAGLLVPTSSPAPWPPPVIGAAPGASWGGAEQPAGAGRPVPGPVTAGAVAALATVLALERAGRRRTTMRRLIRALRWSAAACLRPASAAEAGSAVLAVRSAAWYSPARTACLEESAAATLLLASRRLGVTWCHGVAADPVRLHAWVQTDDGHPVAEPASTLSCTALLTIGARHECDS